MPHKTPNNGLGSIGCSLKILIKRDVADGTRKGAMDFQSFYLHEIILYLVTNEQKSEATMTEKLLRFINFKLRMHNRMRRERCGRDKKESQISCFKKVSIKILNQKDT